LGPPWFLEEEKVSIIEAFVEETMDGTPFLVTIQLDYLDGW